MPDFVSQIEDALRRQRLLRKGQPLLVAVSGGLDSMVLLHVLHRLQRQHRWRLTVAHFNHRLRGRASAADEQLVRRTADQLGLPSVIERADVKQHARAAGLSLEMAARQLRHDFLARAAQARRIRVMALAHHADDQVELFFLRLLRGAGSEGLAGMKWRSPSPANPRLTLIRPLLEQSRDALRQYASAHKLPFREDATNHSLEYQRNRIRHELLPLLTRGYQPALPRIIFRQQELLAAESALLDEWTNDWFVNRNRTPFDHLPLALQRRVLQRQLIEQGIEPDFDLIESLRAQPAKRLMVNPQSTVARNPDGLIVVQRLEPKCFQAATLAVDLSSEQKRCEFGGVNFEWRFQRRSGSRLPNRKPGGEWFDADRVGSQVILRHWRPGDRFQPSGMAASVKLQDLFTNARIASSLRRQLVVATTTDDRLWWVESLRIAEKFKLAGNTKRRLRWQWERIGQAVSIQSQ